MNFLSKIIFSWKKPRVVVITGQDRFSIRETISRVLKFSQEKNVLILTVDLDKKKEIDNLKFLLPKTSLVIFVSTAIDNNDLATIEELTKISTSKIRFVLNFDKEITREVKEKILVSCLTYGFQEGADFQATDLKTEEGTNFKINYKGNSVPVWLEKSADKEQVYSALAAVAVGTIFDLNLVEISQALKAKEGFPR